MPVRSATDGAFSGKGRNERPAFVPHGRVRPCAPSARFLRSSAAYGLFGRLSPLGRSARARWAFLKTLWRQGPSLGLMVAEKSVRIESDAYGPGGDVPRTCTARRGETRWHAGMAPRAPLQTGNFLQMGSLPQTGGFPGTDGPPRAIVLPRTSACSISASPSSCSSRWASSSGSSPRAPRDRSSTPSRRQILAGRLPVRDASSVTSSSTRCATAWRACSPARGSARVT